MITNTSICRFCKDWAQHDDLVRYGTRHYAHFACYLEAGKSLNDLPVHQVKRFPYRLLKARGLVPALLAKYKPGELV